MRQRGREPRASRRARARRPGPAGGRPCAPGSPWLSHRSLQPRPPGEDGDPCPEGWGLRRELQKPPRKPRRGGRDQAEKRGHDGAAGELALCQARCQALEIGLHQVTAAGSSGDRDSGLGAATALILLAGEKSQLKYAHTCTHMLTCARVRVHTHTHSLESQGASFLTRGD